jgi:hypothetical protein
MEAGGYSPQIVSLKISGVPEGKDFGKSCHVHSIGNGRICAYIHGADIFDIVGPYYSTPSLFQLICRTPGELTAKRVLGSAVWDYSIGALGSWRDFTVLDQPVFVRDVHASVPITWQLRKLALTRWIRAPDQILNCTRFKTIWCGAVPAGTFLYVNQHDPDGRSYGYPVTDRLFVIAAVSGDPVVKISDADKVEFTISQGEITLVCAQDEDSAWRILEECNAVNSADLCARTLEAWERFTTKRLSFLPVLDKQTADMTDDIAVLLKTQQDESGGILAGCNYHLSYVRDNYGCFRGLIAVGCREEARKLLRYYAEMYRRNGTIATAQGMGVFALHKHEHDFAENTGYLVLMAMEYFTLTRDLGLLKELVPLIRWSLSEQEIHLVKGMLPFSGDETYIAGGILPRIYIQDGSMEAPLLYHRSLELCLPIAHSLELIDKDFLKSQERVKNTIEENFTRNFIDGEILYCNKSGLYDENTAPKRRAGVMECGHGFGISYRTGTGRYVCLECLGKNDLESVPLKRFTLLSTAFMPIWTGSCLVPREILISMVKNICHIWTETGKLPSRPEGGITVGYDYGLTLYAISRICPEDKDAYDSIKKAMLDVRDMTGAWVEYYDYGKPMGTPCRPWESAVNIAALLEGK